MNVLVDLSLHGSLVAAVVWLLDRALARRMAARSRRGWWVLVPVAFLVFIPLPVLPSLPAAFFDVGGTNLKAALPAAPATGGVSSAFQAEALLPALWLTGVAVYLLVVVIQTRAAVWRWSRIRLSTDSALLDLLEDCKARAGVTAPIGLVISDRVAVPALMGWLRPRILLPEKTVAALSPSQLRAVLLHELAHFRALDVPLGWLFTLARAVHWFNPVVHLAARAWAGFREEAADEAALRMLSDAAGPVYGEALLAALRHAQTHSTPFGALAIGESIHHLKRRLVMIHHHPHRSPRLAGAAVVLILLASATLLRPVRAAETDAKQAAEAAMQTWLGEMDQGGYAQSWKDAAPSFQKAVTAQKWSDLSTSVRTPLGKCLGRKLASALEQTGVNGTGKGDYVIAQFDSSFENLKYAIETVTFKKAPDGTWKAAGYYIKPGA